jgi:hypothetical protein
MKDPKLGLASSLFTNTSFTIEVEMVGFYLGFMKLK